MTTIVATAAATFVFVHLGPFTLRFQCDVLVINCGARVFARDFLRIGVLNILIRRSPDDCDCESNSKIKELPIRLPQPPNSEALILVIAERGSDLSNVENNGDNSTDDEENGQANVDLNFSFWLFTFKERI